MGDGSSGRTDEELIADIAARGPKAPEAMAEIFDRYQQPVLRIAMASLRDRDLSMDVFGDVLEVVWRDAHRFRGLNGATVRSWIFSIASNKAINSVKKRSLLGRLTDRLGKPAEEFVGPDDPLLPIQVRTLSHCLSKLPPRQRQVVHLAFVEEQSRAEIAEIIHRKPTGVRAGLHFALRNLRECFERRGVSYGDD